MPPRFCDEVEEFLDLVFDDWELLLALSGKPLQSALYKLYNKETHPHAMQGGYTPSQIEAVKKVHESTFKNNTVRDGGYFIEFYSGNFDPEQQGEEYRVYVNSSSSTVVQLALNCIALCAKYEAIAYFKFPKNPNDADTRRDAVVVYLIGEWAARAVARELHRATYKALPPTVPSMTRRVAPGISIAPDMASTVGKSFGELVVSPFALAITVYRDTFFQGGLLRHTKRRTCTEVFRLLLAGAFRAHGLNPQAPFASGGGYVPNSVKVANAIGAVELSLAKRRAARRDEHYDGDEDGYDGDDD